MGAREDLGHVGAPIDDAVRTAAFIGGMILTKRQKAALLRDYLAQSGKSLNEDVRRAADVYADAL